jgi:hypothetical protein
MKNNDQDACRNGIKGPAVPLGITCEALRKHEAYHRQRDEDDKTEDIHVDDSVKGLSARRSWWLTENRICHEKTSTNEADSEEA